MLETVLFYWGFIFIGASFLLAIFNRIKINQLRKEIEGYAKYIEDNFQKKHNEVDRCFHFEDDMF